MPQHLTFIISLGNTETDIDNLVKALTILEGRRKKEEGRKKKEEGRRKMSEGRFAQSPTLPLSPSPTLPTLPLSPSPLPPGSLLFASGNISSRQSS
jgi:arginine decarboxylase